MPISRTGKLLRPSVPSLPGASRRAQWSATTKRTLVDVATDLFTTQGYAATSLDTVVAGAEVTKGALYHHFSGKQALFEAVFERVETDAALQIRAALDERADPWDNALAGLGAFLDVVRHPSYRRIVVQDGPAVLGYERFREQEERSSYAIVVDLVASVLGRDGTLDDDMLATFSRIFFGAMSSAGEAVTESDDPETASERVAVAIGIIVAGLRTQVEAGLTVAPVGPDSDGDEAEDGEQQPGG